MLILQQSFINELGNKIDMSVQQDQHGITVVATGPTSQVEHTWTPLEAATLTALMIRSLTACADVQYEGPEK